MQNEASKGRRRRVSISRAHTDSGIVAELLSLLETATADGTISDEEAKGLNSWLKDNESADLPSVEFLRTVVGQVLADGKVTTEERRELYKAVEKVLPPEARRVAKERRTAVETLEKARKREAVEQERSTAAAERRERQLNRPAASSNFMVAGVLYEGRARVVETHARAGVPAYLARDPNNAYDPAAIQVRLENGMCALGSCRATMPRTSRGC